MADDLKLEPDKDRLYGLLRAQKTASPIEFMRAMSPETHGLDLGPPDTMDHVFNSLGIVTDRVGKLRKAAEVEKSLLPLYDQYAEYNNKRIQTGATIGEARSLGSPVPPGSVSEGSMEVPRSIVPDTFNIDELQHPAAGGQRNWATTGQSGYDSPGEGNRLLPTDTTDNQALLPPGYQSRFNATIHRSGLRGNLKEDRIGMARERLHDLQVLGMKPDYEDEISDLRTELKLSPMTYASGSAKGRIDEATAKTKEALVPYAGKQAEANLDKTNAQTGASRANTQTENTLRQARLDLLLAKTEKAQKEAHYAGDMSKSEELKQKGLLFGVLKHGVATGQFDEGEQVDIENRILQGTGLEATREKPGAMGAVREFFGFNPGGGVHIQKRQPDTGNPMQQDSTLAPQQGDLQAPVSTQAEAPEMDKKAMAKALYDRMKEGDTQTFDGVKYKKQGSKLVRVQ